MLCEHPKTLVCEPLQAQEASYLVSLSLGSSVLPHSQLDMHMRAAGCGLRATDISPVLYIYLGLPPGYKVPSRTVSPCHAMRLISASLHIHNGLPQRTGLQGLPKTEAALR